MDVWVVSGLWVGGWVGGEDTSWVRDGRREVSKVLLSCFVGMCGLVVVPRLASQLPFLSLQHTAHTHR